MNCVHVIPISSLSFIHFILSKAKVKMNKSDLISKYGHALVLCNYSHRTVEVYLSGLRVFISFLQENNVQEVTPEIL